MKTEYSPNFFLIALVSLAITLTLSQRAHATTLEDARIYRFEDANQETLFRNITAELRCLVCQNQNIADSNAELAVDLRLEVYEKVKQGLSKDDIVDFAVTRYGDFVLYRPTFKGITYLLWLAPFIALLSGAFLWTRIVQKRQTEPTQKLTESEQQALAQLLTTAESPTAKRSSEKG